MRPSARPGAALAVVLGACGLLALAGAPRAVAATNGEQARICRSILLVLNPAQSLITVEQSRSVGFEDGVTILYDVEAPGQRRRYRRITCAFAKSRLHGHDLVAVSSDGRSLGPARLALLKRFWLNSPEAARAEGSIAEKR